MNRGPDTALRILCGLTVAGLAIVAGAISFDHMRELALRHDQLGWKSYAFPVSVDGLEIVASLYLVAQRRVGRPTGWVPWVALASGTLASLTANVAVGGSDLIGKALAGWPALSMLAAVKLLFSMIDHDGVDQRTTAKGDRGPSADHSSVPRTVQRAAPESAAPFGTVPAEQADGGASSAKQPHPTSGLAPASGPVAGSVGLRDVAHLIPAARVACAALVRDGRPLSRDNLADRMREEGFGVSNSRAGVLVRLLRVDMETATTPALGRSARATGPDERVDPAA